MKINQWVAGLYLEHSKLFILIFVIKKNKLKGFLQRILQEIMKKIIVGTWDARSMRWSSHHPSDPAYYIEDCQIYAPEICHYRPPFLRTNPNKKFWKQWVLYWTCENFGFLSKVGTWILYPYPVPIYEISLILAFTKCGLCMTMWHMSIRVLESAHLV